MRILLTGTDTGVGKTWVGCALARALRAAGYRVTAVKPVETGCGEERDGEDGVLLAKSTGQAEPAAALVRLPEPVAPALALELARSGVDLGELVLEIERHAAAADVLLVEGAGGLLTPITWGWNAADLARALGARALVVGADRLGVINHTLLTLGTLNCAAIPIVGVVLTAPDLPDRSIGTNAGAIARLSGMERILVVPRTSAPAAAARALAPVVGWLETLGVQRTIPTHVSPSTSPSTREKVPRLETIHTVIGEGPQCRPRRLLVRHGASLHESGPYPLRRPGSSASPYRRPASDRAHR